MLLHSRYKCNLKESVTFDNTFTSKTIFFFLQLLTRNWITTILIALEVLWTLTGEGGCCLKEPTKSFPLPSLFAWWELGPSLSSVAKWNSLARVRLSTADLQGMYDCPARAFFMETLFCLSFSIISFCFCAMTCSSCSSLVFCAWVLSPLDWATLLKIYGKK